jgi:hypothetical protein
LTLIGNYSTSSGARRPSPSRIHFECLYPPAVATLSTAYRPPYRVFYARQRMAISPSIATMCPPLSQRIPRPSAPLMPLHPLSTPTQDRLPPSIACLRQRHIAAPESAVPASLPAANTASGPRSVAGRSTPGALYIVLEVHSSGAGGRTSRAGLGGSGGGASCCWLLVLFGPWALE